MYQCSSEEDVGSIVGSDHGVDAGPGRDRPLTHPSFVRRHRQRTGPAAAPGTATWTLIGGSNSQAVAGDVVRARWQSVPGVESVAKEAEDQGLLRERRGTLSDRASLFECRFDAQF